MVYHFVLDLTFSPFEYLTCSEFGTRRKLLVLGQVLCFHVTLYGCFQDMQREFPICLFEDGFVVESLS